MGFLYVSNTCIKKSTCRSASWELLVNENNELVALDFWCMKAIPNDFVPYFELIDKKVIDTKKYLRRNF
jgi:hypothetical protein